jgi:hypothetical protein
MKIEEEINSERKKERENRKDKNFKFGRCGVVCDRFEWLVGKNLAEGGYNQKCASAKGLSKI